MSAAPAVDAGEVVTSWRVGTTAPSQVMCPGAPELRDGTTVVIATYRRPQSLRRCLDSLVGELGASDEVLVVDASDDGASEAEVRRWVDDAPVAMTASYYRVTGSLRGVIPQRNFALDRVETELVAIFDDDIVVSPGCLDRFATEFRKTPHLVGIGALVINESRPLDWQWRVRRFLRAVPDLRPGRYHRSGVSVPWTHVLPGSGPLAADWLPGGASAWRARAASTVKFDEGLQGRGYAASDDLDFSIRMRRFGALVMDPGIQVQHFPDRRGRPDPGDFGYMEILNRYRIHGRAFETRSALDIAWFTYAWLIDTLLLCRSFLIPSRWNRTARQIGGRLRAAIDLVRNPGAGTP